MHVPHFKDFYYNRPTPMHAADLFEMLHGSNPVAPDKAEQLSWLVGMEWEERTLGWRVLVYPVQPGLAFWQLPPAAMSEPLPYPEASEKMAALERVCRQGNLMTYVSQHPSL